MARPTSRHNRGARKNASRRLGFADHQQYKEDNTVIFAMVVTRPEILGAISVRLVVPVPTFVSTIPAMGTGIVLVILRRPVCNVDGDASVASRDLLFKCASPGSLPSGANGMSGI